MAASSRAVEGTPAAKAKAVSVPWSTIPDSYFDELPSRLVGVAYLVVGQILRRTRWGDAVLMRNRDEWAHANKPEIARILNVTEVAVYHGFREAEKTGYLRVRRKNGRSEYSVDVAKFSTGPLRSARTLERGRQDEPAPAPLSLPVALTCPKGYECPVAEVWEGEDGQFRNPIDSTLPIRQVKNTAVANTAVTAKTINSGLGEQKAKGVWEEVKSSLRSSLPREAYANWFEQSEGIGLAAGVLDVAVPNRATASWLEEEYGMRIADLLPAGVVACYVVRHTETPAQVAANPGPADSQKAMVEWLEAAVPLNQVGRVLPHADAEALWKLRQEAPREIFEAAIIAKVRKIQSWRFAVMLVEEAVGEYQNRLSEGGTDVLGGEKQADHSRDGPRSGPAHQTARDTARA